MKTRRKGMIALGLVVSLLFPLGFGALAADFPTKPITFVIPYPAGRFNRRDRPGLVDAAKKYLSQPIISENKSGEGERSARP